MHLLDRKTDVAKLSQWLHLGGAALVLLIMAAVHYLVFQPMELELEALQNEELAAEAYLTRKSVIDADHIRLQASVEDGKRRYTELLQRIPPAAGEADFLASLSKIAADHGVKISDYRPGATAKFPTHSEFEIRVAVEGNYAALCRLLYDLEQMPRVCQVVNLRCQNAAGGSYRFELTGKVLFAAGSVGELSHDNARQG